MSSLKLIVCLANSWKLGERCIAGIDLDTGKWVRPICDQLYPEDGRVPQKIRLVNGREPELLDILEIPLANTGNNFGFESENFSVLPGQWKLIGKAKASDLLKYVKDSRYILHNTSKYVKVSDLEAIPLVNRETLQLVHTSEFSVESKVRSSGNVQWKANLRTENRQELREAIITDPVFVKKLESGYQPQGSYLVTVSLSMPWQPPDWQDPAPCWKLVAGVIELPKPESDLVDVNLLYNLLVETDKEMQRVGWTVKEGRDYLIQKYNKVSRRQLTQTEFYQFLNYLKSLPRFFDDIEDIPF